MGHLINPISTRLGFTSFWISNWSCFSLANFSYNLMVDNLVKNFISWAFSENKASLSLTVLGAFLSHFKILRRGNNIRVFVFLILDSSKFFRSQNVELDSKAINLLGTYRNFKKHYELSSLLLSKKKLFFKLKKKVYKLNHVYNKYIYFLKNLFFKKFILNFISTILSHLLSRFFYLNKHFYKFKVNVDPIFIKTISFLNANFLARFLARRLSYGFELNRVLKPLVINLKKLVDSRLSKIVGFRISCRGRFNKAQMASYTWEKYGPIPLNNFFCSVDYSFSNVFMKYGACGIKVWIFTSHSVFKNYRSVVLRKATAYDIKNLVWSKSDFFSKLYGDNTYFLQKILLLLRLFSESFSVRFFLQRLFFRFADGQQIRS